MGATVISTGVDGKPSIWPASAISRDKHGVFRDYKGNVVGVGTEMDTATPTKSNATAVDAFANRIADNLLAALQREDDAAIERQVRAAMAFDGKEEEQEALFDDNEGEAEDSPDNSVDGTGYEAMLKASRDYWSKVRRVKPSATYHAARSRTNKSAAVDHVAANAKRSKSYSMFDHPERMKRARA